MADLLALTPFTIEEVTLFAEAKDYGVYQIYGTHNVLGTDALLYIGQACSQTFATRLPQREYITWGFPEYRIYLGRLGSKDVVTEQERSLQIDYAEQILIDYCQPPYNSQLLNGLSSNIPDDIVVLKFS